ncbi:MAG: hypothetical protein GY706_01360 [Bacteroides sp.]|nr:hypothetical protein [Bacteroides sp.]
MTKASKNNYLTAQEAGKISDDYSQLPSLFSAIESTARKGGRSIIAYSLKKEEIEILVSLDFKVTDLDKTKDRTVSFRIEW